MAKCLLKRNKHSHWNIWCCNICYIRRLPVSISLGAASLTGAIASGIISTLTKKYQKKLKKVTKLTDIITRATVVFDRIRSGALKDGVIDEEEFNTLQTLHLETLNELTGVYRRMEAENRSLVEKSLMEEINELKKKQKQEIDCLLSLLFRMLLLKRIKYTTNLIIFGKVRKQLKTKRT